MAHCGAAIIHDIHFPGLNMKLTGRCYCGDIQYEFEGEVQGALQCHCRECQYITGGNANVIMVLPESGFRFAQPFHHIPDGIPAFERRPT